jgi:hypothetical protein
MKECHNFVLAECTCDVEAIESMGHFNRRCNDYFAFPVQIRVVGSTILVTTRKPIDAIRRAAARAYFAAFLAARRGQFND